MHGRSRMTTDPRVLVYDAGTEGGCSLSCVAVLVRGGGGRAHLLLALVILPLTTHPFRDGAPFLLLIETPLQHLGAHYVVSV